jgi:hypothetical protein
MSEDFNLLVGRLCARERRRALPVRSTYSIASDPPETFGIAFIRVAAEERVQAAAYGLMGAEPSVITICNPLARGAHELEPLAHALDDYLTTCDSWGELPRIWLPHAAALTVLDLLGYRYQSNRHVTGILRKMGRLCRALCEEATFPGQQVVAVASALLTEHVVTGQSAVEDLHLGALLAWTDPSPGVDPIHESQRRALTPAASLLDKDSDDEVERLRRHARQCIDDDEVKNIHSRIRVFLEEGVRREWVLLEEARTAFWSLGLEPASSLRTIRLVRESREHLRHFLLYGTRLPSRPHTLSLQLDSYEHTAALAKERDACEDERMRERLRSIGRMLRARVEAVDQPNENRHPCTLTLTTNQPVQRVRPGTRLKSGDDQVEGAVVNQAEDSNSGEHRIVFRLSKGVRKGRPQVGQELELVDTIPFDSRRIKRMIYKRMREDESPLIYHNSLPPSVPRRLPLGSILELAEELRRR